MIITIFGIIYIYIKIGSLALAISPDLATHEPRTSVAKRGPGPATPEVRWTAEERTSRGLLVEHLASNGPRLAESPGDETGKRGRNMAKLAGCVLKTVMNMGVFYGILWLIMVYIMVYYGL